jgi:hypothetical protein
MDTYVTTKQDAIAIRKKWRQMGLDAHYVKAKHWDGYNCWAFKKALEGKGAKKI